MKPIWIFKSIIFFNKQIILILAKLHAEKLSPELIS